MIIHNIYIKYVLSEFQYELLEYYNYVYYLPAYMCHSLEAKPYNRQPSKKDKNPTSSITDSGILNFLCSRYTLTNVPHIQTILAELEKKVYFCRDQWNFLLTNKNNKVESLQTNIKSVNINTIQKRTTRL